MAADRFRGSQRLIVMQQVLVTGLGWEGVRRGQGGIGGGGEGA